VKIAVYGAGAIGGLIACHLARAGADVTVIARGATLAAIRKAGITVETPKGEIVNARPAATDDTRAAGPQDYVIMAVKAHQAPALVPQVAPMLGRETAVVTAMNGVPWWYFHKHGGPHDGRPIETVDPGRAQWDGIGPARAIGAIVYPAAEAKAPAVIKHIGQDRFSLGEPDGAKSPRVLALSQALIAAGFAAPVRPAIREEIWLKLIGNLSFNPLSALTGATLDVMAHEPEMRALVKRMMEEGEAVAKLLGVTFPISLDKRIDGAGRLAGHRTSMLVDFENRRAPEIDALVAAVQEFARMLNVPTPAIDVVLAIVRSKARTLGIYP
jgi:2-dehydropantoate 2-reductase